MIKIEAPKEAKHFDTTVSYSSTTEEYELVFAADFYPCGCTRAKDPATFKEFKREWKANGKVTVPSI